MEYYFRPWPSKRFFEVEESVLIVYNHFLLKRTLGIHRTLSLFSMLQYRVGILELTIN